MRRKQRRKIRRRKINNRNKIVQTRVEKFNKLMRTLRIPLIK